MIDRNTLRIMARSILRQAWDFRCQSEDVLPTWFIQGRQGNQIMGTPWSDDIEKMALALAAAEVVRDTEADSVLLVTDAWVRVLEPGQSTKQRPSEDPESVEALTVQCWMADGSGFNMMRQYRTGDDGQLHVVDDMERPEPAESETFASVLEALAANRGRYN